MYDVLGPLWAVIDLGAVAEAPEARSVRDFVSAHRAELDALLEVVRELGDFSAETMKMRERPGGWGSDESRSVTAESLMVYSGCIEAYPPDTDDPLVLRRMVGMGCDLQLAMLMDGLVGAAMMRVPESETGARLVVSVVRKAAAMLGAAPERAARDTFRVWRVAFLPGVLRPDSPTTEAARERLRTYAHALEETVGA
ncbi:hypothetical protein OG864_23050 [Streptomyces sp. NBC_00124]|uniref:hypothetical protein n=1 Tax=Streptomyces sp. NBC_00124 TaxID=2975662 RepID=UPI002259C1A8|nr:hypothetical protein [Streptomyces sp. NBC_00124]MCX5361590.1 hypothetical protein [Streptomyces sp. NBC_00124]